MDPIQLGRKLLAVEQRVWRSPKQLVRWSMEQPAAGIKVFRQEL